MVGIHTISFLDYVRGGHRIDPLTALLEYAIDSWHYHMKHQISAHEENILSLKHLTDYPTSLIRHDSSRSLCYPGFIIGLDQRFDPFWRLIVSKSLTFEVRPWGPNQHVGPFGCSGCPPEESVRSHSLLDALSAIHWAAITDNYPVLYAFDHALKRCLAHETYHNRTLLDACRHGSARMIRLLLQYVDRTAISKDVLQATCRVGKLDNLEPLIKHNQTIDHGYWPAAGTELVRIAAQEGHVDILKYLFKKGVEDFPDNDGWLAQHWAARNGHKDVIKYLLGRIHSVDASTNKFETSLAIAARHGHADTVIELLELGASAEASTKDYIPPVLDFPWREQWFGAGANSPPSVIHWAAYYGWVDVLKRLIAISSAELLDRSTRIEISSARSSGEKHTPPLRTKSTLEPNALGIAVMFHNVDAAKVLLEAGSSANLGFPQTLDPGPRNYPLTGMQYAMASNDSKMMDLLEDRQPLESRHDYSPAPGTFLFVGFGKAPMSAQ